MLLQELCDDYLSTNPAIRSPHTERLILTSAKHFARHLGRTPLVADLTDRELVAYVKHRRSLGRAEATIEREAAKLMSVWRYAAHRQLVAPPLIHLRKAKVDTPVAFLRWEVRKLFRAAARYPSPIAGVPGHLVLVALLAVIWDTAERIGALCEVTRADIDCDGRWITIRSRKNGGRTLIRPLRRTTARALRELLAANPAKKPFGFVHRGSLYHHLDKVLALAGLPQTRRHKFHCLRRSHASYLHAAGGDARESLDHADEQTTRTRYYDPRVAGPANVLRFLFDPLSWYDRLMAWLGR